MQNKRIENSAQCKTLVNVLLDYSPAIRYFKCILYGFQNAFSDHKLASADGYEMLQVIR